MLDRATDDLIAIAIAVAASVLTVFAAGFAIYAALLPSIGSPWAAAVVAMLAAAVVGVFALLAHFRAQRKERERAEAEAQLMTQIPMMNVGDMARERPMLALGVTLLGGALAARHPKLARDLISIVARMTMGR